MIIVAEEEAVKKKGRMGHTFAQQLKGGTHGGTKENETLVHDRGGNTLNATCYNFLKPDHLYYNFPEAGCTGTYPLQVIHSFSHKNIQQNDPINEN